MDGAGFEPATSAMPTPPERGSAPLHTPIMKVSEKILQDFERFLRVDRRLRPATVQHTVEDIRRFLRRSDYIVSYQNISNYLEGYLNKAPKTYNQQITSLRRFVRDFLGCERLISSFKMAPVDVPQEDADITRAQVRKGFYAQPDVRSKAIYLFTATTGLRKGEILGLLKENVDFEMRAVKPDHFTRSKRSGVTFYNREAEEWLLKYLESRKDEDPRLFVISDRQWRLIWRRASEATGVKITAQVLRKWFSTEMGELGVPDRYVDIFQGRAPRTVISKHYTGKALLRLKRIYDKAGLSVLSRPKRENPESLRARL